MPRDPQQPPRLWSTQDLADYLGVAVPTLHAMRARGEGPPAYRVGRVLRFDPAEVDDWLHTEAREPSPAPEQPPSDVLNLGDRREGQRHA